MSFIELPFVNPGEVIESSYNNQNKYNTDYLKDKVDILYNSFNPLFQIQHTTATGVNGGTFTAGAWRNRVLNTVVVNEIEGASIDEITYAITLPIGKYEINSICYAFRVGYHYSRLYNITDDEVLCESLQAYHQEAAYYSDSFSFINNRFELTKETLVQLQHRCRTTHADIGFGGSGDNQGQSSNIHADVRIYKTRN